MSWPIISTFATELDVFAERSCDTPTPPNDPNGMNRIARYPMTLVRFTFSLRAAAHLNLHESSQMR